MSDALTFSRAAHLEALIDELIGSGFDSARAACIAEQIMSSEWYEATVAHIVEVMAIPLRILGRLLVEQQELTLAGESMLLQTLEEMQ